MGKKRWHHETQEDREALWPLSATERYISVDVEMDGPVPGLHSMLCLGAAAYNPWGQQIGKAAPGFGRPCAGSTSTSEPVPEPSTGARQARNLKRAHAPPARPDAR